MSAKQVNQKITFADLARLTDREIQMILREIDTKDLAVALKGAKKGLTERILSSNMSERVGAMVKEEMVLSADVPMRNVEEMQLRIEDIVEKLHEVGQITWPPRPVAKKALRRRQKLGKEYVAQKRATSALVRRSLSELSLDEINQMFVELAEIGRREGILALEKMMKGRGDKFLAAGLRLAVDGTEPELVQAILGTWMSSLMHEHEIKYHKVMEGIMSIQSGDNPRIVEQKLNVLY